MTDKIDTELLISLVKSRPLLWDKSLESHRDLDQRSGAWREICKVLCPEYMNRKAKHVYAKLVIKKWTNIRDAWRKSYMDTKMKKKVKPYLYHDYLRFLEKNLYYVKGSLLNGDEAVTIRTEDEEGDKMDKSSAADSDDACDEPARGGKRKIAEPQDWDGTPPCADASLGPAEESPHMSFARGLLPALGGLSDDEVLEFQAGVIQLLQGIRRRGASAAGELPPRCGLPEPPDNKE